MSQSVGVLKNGYNRNFQIAKGLRKILKTKYLVKETELPLQPTYGMEHKELVKIIEEMSIKANECEAIKNRTNESQIIGDTGIERGHKPQRRNLTSQK